MGNNKSSTVEHSRGDLQFQYEQLLWTIENFNRVNKDLEAEIQTIREELKRSENSRVQEEQKNTQLQEIRRKLEEEREFERERSQKESMEVNLLRDSFNVERGRLVKELEEKQILNEQKDKIIAEKTQAIINERAINDSSIVSCNLDDGSIKPQDVLNQFDKLMDSILDLRCSIVELPEIKTNQRLVHKLLLAALFGDGFWKLLKKPLDTRRLTKQSVAKILTRNQDERFEEVQQFLQEHLEISLRDSLGKLIGEEIDKLEPNVRECCENALFLAVYLISSEPIMGIISPKEKDDFNPEKHEDATSEGRMTVKSVKRPGLICVRDNRVFARASVETSFQREN